MAYVPLMFMSEWREFPSAPCLAGKRNKIWWRLASWCCWNSARRLTCFLSASVISKDMQFGTWTDPSFERHYRFRPTTLGSRSGKGLNSILNVQFIFSGAKDPSWPKHPHYSDFTMTLRHTTVGRPPLYEWSARRRYLYLTTHST